MGSSRLVNSIDLNGGFKEKLMLAVRLRLM